MLITDVRPRRKMISQLYIDGEAAVQVDTQVWLYSGLCAGKEITDEVLHALLQESERKRAKEKALYLLTYRNHSKKELEEKLKALFSPETVQETVARMEKLGLLDDEKYAQDMAAYWIQRKHYSAYRAVYELEQKGISHLCAQEAVQMVAPDPRQAISEILARKYAQAYVDETCRNRAVRALQRLGYRYGDIRAVLTEKQNDETEWE